MVDMSSIAALAGSLKAAADITAAAIDIRDGAKLQSKVIELQTIILSAQSSALMAQQDQFTLIEESRVLRRRIEQLEAWDGAAEDYELRQVDPGAFAYVSKSLEERGAANPWLCTNCFEAKRKSVLQFRGLNAQNTHDSYECPNCKGKISVYYGTSPEGGRSFRELSGP